MQFSRGARLGPYEIESSVGAGGMGEVYRARDTRLNRTVAVKILLDGLASDVQSRERFDREARSISALEHPHVCSLYDVGEHDGRTYLVMQFLEGESLAERIQNASQQGHPIGTSEALAIGMQIAAALDAAHRLGIVHRDLKPGNVILTKSGAKLLDFGLAKSRPGGAAIGSAGDTHSRPVTAEGTLLGTLAYMSPEQIEGNEADARSDIWALGCVLYEMLTGMRPFSGTSPASVIGSILRDAPPPVSRAAALSPPALDRVVAKCLSKDPEGRWQSAADLRDTLRWIADGESIASAPALDRPFLSRRAAIVGGVLAALVALAAAALWTVRAPVERSDARPTRLAVVLPPEVSFDGSPAISPDGARIVFVGRSAGRSALWVRDLDTLKPRLLPGTDDAVLPFWSPDGRSVGFFTDGWLKRIDADGSALQRITTASNGRGGTWNRQGVILFAPSPTDGLYRVAASGGPAQLVTQLDRSRQENSHRFPQFFPDGKRFIFRVRSSVPGNTGLYVAALDDRTPRSLLSADSPAVVMPGHLIFARESTVFAQAFDFDTLALLGDPAPIAVDVGYDSTTARGSFTASLNGVLAYYVAEGDPAQNGSLRLTWFDRAGRRLASIGEAGLPLNPALSPNGRYVAFDRVLPQTGARNLWLADLERNIVSRFTFSGAADVGALWTPDGTSVLFASSRDGPNQLYRKNRASGVEEKILDLPGIGLPGSISADGSFVVLTRSSRETRNDIWVLRLDGDRQARPFVVTPFEERQPRLSPDGHWLAYISDESGRNEVYLHSFPDAREKLRVSTSGGAQPQWRRDGRELYYLASDQKLMAVPISTQSGAVSAGTPQALFPMRTYTLTQNRNDYVPDSSGQRFLLTVTGSEQPGAPIVIMQNWLAALPRYADVHR